MDHLLNPSGAAAAPTFPWPQPEVLVSAPPLVPPPQQVAAAAYGVAYGVAAPAPAPAPPVNAALAALQSLQVRFARSY